ncbi:MULTISPECIES: hypothetical protein [unclassified Streptomyces]|uniref:DUF4190 domain-containing protein n=2 Tax=Streptomyces TaxID=1883 RepID=A0ABU2QXW2_9ACTN|nr:MULTISPECIES: hypothetical protein [unclassified Streptomyces]EFL02763.1 predicted protein [Streptomyces sp. SPB78]MDT0408952.1 hypothetical protein [Streptomyces sp. DSM 41979]MYQ57789.1 hypothetical protein [Streptomyces sp. SID4926]SCE58374.1 hypothetical protein GA0115252_171412 [Streptomyces sp. DfronAA-171]
MKTLDQERRAHHPVHLVRLARVVRPTSTEPATSAAPSASRRDADAMAVAAFVLGLLGLLVLNVVLGPVALVLAGLALWRGTARRGRALLGLGLGIADLVVFFALAAADSTLSWSM